MPLYYKVPYSSHSNYRELEKFVKAVSPKKLIFNVDDRGDDSKSRSEFQQYLVKEYVSNGKPQIQSIQPSLTSTTVGLSNQQIKTFAKPQQHGYQRAVAEMT